MVTCTAHGTARMQQRGFRQMDIELIDQYGEFLSDERLMITRRSVELAISDGVTPSDVHRLERLVGAVAVIGNRRLVTAFWSERAPRRTASRGRHHADRLSQRGRGLDRRGSRK